jgi:adhesin transport system membrane fusion protein
MKQLNNLITQVKEIFRDQVIPTYLQIKTQVLRIARVEPDTERFSENSRRKLIRIVAIVFLVLFLWASLAEIDQTTRAQGQVIPVSRSQIIQSFDGGVLEELLVREGDKVEKGQLLARLDRTRMQSTFLETRAKAAALSGTVSRLRTEVYNTPLTFNKILNEYPEFKANQRFLLSKRQKALNDDVSALTSQLELAKTELAMTEPLLKTGDVSKVEVIKLQRQLNDIQSQIINKQNKYFQDAQAELSKVEEELASITQVLTQKQEQLDRVELHSPMSGTVKNVRITTLGGVIKQGEEVMQIVPSGDHLMIEAKVKPTEVAFLKPGLPVIIKIDAYDYSIYGTLNGKLTFISPDTINEESRSGEQIYYRIQIQTDDTNFSGKPKERIEIQPGMTSTIEIITGKHSVLSYLTKPVTKTLSESMRER